MLHHRLEGLEGAPLLVFSNSLGAELGMWDGQAAEFGKTFRVLRYDNRGHGGSSNPPPGPYTIEQVASDAADLIEHVGEKAAYFCGLSLGGMVGMWLGTHRPELIQKLVLCNTSAMLGPRENWETRIATVKQGGMQAVVGPVIERWFTEGFRQKAPEIVARTQERFLKVDVEGYVGCCAAIRDMDQREAIAGINAKTMVIAGTYDQSTPPAMGKFIADRISGSQYVELPAAHLSNIEAAPAFNENVMKFLNG